MEAAVEFRDQEKALKAIRDVASALCCGVSSYNVAWDARSSAASESWMRFSPWTYLRRDEVVARLDEAGRGDRKCRYMNAALTGAAAHVRRTDPASPSGGVDYNVRETLRAGFAAWLTECRKAYREQIDGGGFPPTN